MSINVSNSVPFENIEFFHVHPYNDEDLGAHKHRTNVTLTFNAKAGESVALPIRQSILRDIRERLVEIASEPIHGNFEDSAVKILEGITEWLPELKKKHKLTAGFVLSEVSIEVFDDCEKIKGVIHPDLSESQVPSITYKARYDCL